ncbi:MAG: ABC transporter permease, partial [Lachnospiraceae bacterium]|nr:ABC transporter permease [Lachnospiraceae bacterium]
GSYLFPWVIMKAYGILYSNIPYLIMPVQWGVSLVSVLIAVVCTVVATMSSCYKELMAAPAILMRPVAPAAGKRVFLEYVKPVWNHLSFSWKATCRNLFRYKKRFFMTIFGIGGCMALLLVGFGLRDSIMEIVSKQYKEIWTYDVYLSINEEEISLEEKEQIVANQMLIQTKTIDVESEEGLVSSTLFVPETLEGLEDFVKLQDRVSGENYTLMDDGVIITEKLAKLLNVSVGDTIELYDDDVTKYPVQIQKIAENYMFHYVYMSVEYYEQLFGETPEYNQLYLKTWEMTEEDKKAFSEEMLADASVDSITYVEELQESVAVMMQSLEMVVVVLIIAAGMLAFIVLYNLNNINIIERRRELATLKVLGFYDGEVGTYVYRENVLLTVLGILAGIVMGFFLHRFVILTVEVDMMMFGRDIEAPSYLYSVLLTCLFAILINFGMFFKLRKIDMASSLKSAE